MEETSRWRAPEDVQGHRGLIGPNAILQLVPVLEEYGGQRYARGLLDRAGIACAPSGAHMIPEADAARLHYQLRIEEPERAPALAAEAGRRTGDYILAHRIPSAAQTLLRVLPPALAARALSRAIARHAWTFAGSGTFRVRSPWEFEIRRNPLIAGETNDVPLCTWHAAVFQHLYSVLVAPDVVCRETSCGAQPGRDACVFRLSRVQE
ncbi:MAG: bacteriochlorophyll 4-vinyl reductase [Pseudomonadota bacterium]